MWIASVVAGTANDAIFMALPMVDDIRESQVRRVAAAVNRLAR